MTDLSKTLVVIPSFGPPETLPSLCEQLFSEGFKNLLIVNDGSPSDSDPIFSLAVQKGATLHSLNLNQGKGNALRVGIQYALEHFEHCSYFVFCDDDGQHLPSDVAGLSRFALEGNHSFVMGTRNISDMPLKSYIGNQCMRLVLKYYHRVDIPDTQSGLRFVSRECSKLLLNLNQNRFSFELHCLLQLNINKVAIETFPIKTIYFNKNRSTRFHPILDSMEVVLSSIFQKTRNKD